MTKRVDVPQMSLDEYEEHVDLAPAVRRLRGVADTFLPAIRGRTVWMVNSTDRGGGVAETLPAEVALLRDLGVATEWVAIETDDSGFFSLTKRLHNLIHGEGEPNHFGAGARELYEEVNRRNAEWFAGRIRPGDILVVHDPQPMPLASILLEETELSCVWRCHIGVDEENDRTRAAWRFLRPYADAYGRAIFSAPEYVPGYLSGREAIIHPGIDPLTHKNRTLSVHKLTCVLANSALSVNPGPVLSAPFSRPAERLLPSGEFAPANMVEDIGLLHRPIVSQLSRWDRLKGFAPLIESFARLKSEARRARGLDPLHRRRLELVRLVLAGPGPGSIADDPESEEVLADLVVRYQSLDPMIQRDLAILSLPMWSRRANALMVNAIQRTSSIVVQNSIREGFGLTVAEAMWKGIPLLSNRRAVGPRMQVRDGVDGCLVNDPGDTGELAEALDSMLAAPDARERWGRSARRRAHEKFLVFGVLERWLEILAGTPPSLPVGRGTARQRGGGRGRGRERLVGHPDSARDVDDR